MRANRDHQFRRAVSLGFVVAASVLIVSAGCGTQPGPIDISDQFDGDTGLPGPSPSGSTEDPANAAPTIDVGSGVIIAREGIILSLSATADDPDGDQVSITWEQLDGLAVFNPTRLQTASPTFLVPEVTSDLLADSILTFEITVEDGNGGFASELVIVQILMAGDATGDDVVDDADRVLVEDRFINGGTPGIDGEGDLNADGVVDLLDLTLVLEQMGRELL
jgi:hypothetical protein